VAGGRRDDDEQPCCVALLFASYCCIARFMDNTYIHHTPKPEHYYYSRPEILEFLGIDTIHNMSSSGGGAATTSPTTSGSRSVVATTSSNDVSSYLFFLFALLRAALLACLLLPFAFRFVDRVRLSGSARTTTTTAVGRSAGRTDIAGRAGPDCFSLLCSFVRRRRAGLFRPRGRVLCTNLLLYLLLYLAG